MSNLALIQRYNETLDMWDDPAKLAQIKALFATSMTDIEFKLFVQLGKNTGLNPFLREIWAVKYGNSAAQIFVGRDGYRKAAQAHPDYEYHQPVAVYSDDDFKIVNDEIQHSTNPFAMGNRQLVGAYCKVKRKSNPCYTYVTVKFSEYTTGKSLWNSKPETMIKKVAEAQALRSAFQDLLGGTYSDAEIPQETKVINPTNYNTQTDRLKGILDAQLSEDDNTTKLATEEQILTMNEMLSKRDTAHEDVNKILKFYEVNTIAELTTTQAESCINRLKQLMSVAAA